MQFLDSKIRAKVFFEPHDLDHIKIYVCGPTVYDKIHLGNARPLVVFDVLYRILQAEKTGKDGRKVTYVRNITDIDDKIYQRAQQQNIDIQTLTTGTIASFHHDCAALGCLQPTYEPRATHHIGEMIALIEILLARQHAYEAEGHILFSIASFKKDNMLFPIKQELLREGGRVDLAPYKKDQSDFVLWKPSGGNTGVAIGWESPFGFGRPGWHIECSAMARKYLGGDFDIHGGGQDLMFPHHFNEYAQSRCAYPEEGFAKYWLHNGYVLVDGEKMSKSLGNFHTISDLLARYDGEILRLVLLMTHYHQPLDFSHEKLIEAENILNRFYQAIATDPQTLTASRNCDYDELLFATLADDLNTPKAIARLHEMVKEINCAKGVEKSDKIMKLIASARLLGLLEKTSQEWFQGCLNNDSSESEIETLIAARVQAKQNKNFIEADQIRDQLCQQGILLEDTAEGTTWKKR